MFLAKGLIVLAIVVICRADPIPVVPAAEPEQTLRNSVIGDDKEPVDEIVAVPAGGWDKSSKLVKTVDEKVALPAEGDDDESIKLVRTVRHGFGGGGFGGGYGGGFGGGYGGGFGGGYGGGYGGGFGGGYGGGFGGGYGRGRGGYGRHGGGYCCG